MRVAREYVPKFTSYLYIPFCFHLIWKLQKVDKLDLILFIHISTRVSVTNLKKTTKKHYNLKTMTISWQFFPANADGAKHIIWRTSVRTRATIFSRAKAMFAKGHVARPRLTTHLLTPTRSTTSAKPLFWLTRQR